MLEYVHFVPGRLRLKITALRHERRAVEAEAKIGAIANVTNARANALTGSLTVEFDRQRLSIGDMWEKLQALGYVSGHHLKPSVTGRAPSEGPGADRFGRAVTAAVIEALVQYSAQALVRTLL